MRQLNLSYLALRKGLQYLCVRDNVSLLVHQSHDWYRKIAEPNGRLAFRPLRLEYMKRFGMAEMLSYILIAGAGVRPGLPLITKTRGFVAPVGTTGVRIQQGRECLAEFAFRNAFRHQLLEMLGAQSASTVTQCTLRVIVEHVHADAAREQGGRLAFRPPCMEHMKRFDTVEMVS